MGSKAKGMQLGSSKVAASVAATALAAQLQEEAEAEESNPWGTDDLLDINPDEDDWSQCPGPFLNSVGLTCSLLARHVQERSGRSASCGATVTEYVQVKRASKLRERKSWHVQRATTYPT